MTKWFYMLMVWLHQWEHDIGEATGMNHAYLSHLRGLIRDYERDLLKMEMR